MTRLTRRVWTRLLGEGSWIKRRGDFREREQYGLVARPHYSYGRTVNADGWYSAMYVCHILDHETRQKPRERQELTIEAHDEFMATRFLY